MFKYKDEFTIKTKNWINQSLINVYLFRKGIAHL